jgi:hypothetical protein
MKSSDNESSKGKKESPESFHNKNDPKENKAKKSNIKEKERIKKINESTPKRKEGKDKERKENLHEKEKENKENIKKLKKEKNKEMSEEEEEKEDMSNNEKNQIKTKNEKEKGKGKVRRNSFSSSNNYETLNFIEILENDNNYVIKNNRSLSLTPLKNDESFNENSPIKEENNEKIRENCDSGSLSLSDETKERKDKSGLDKFIDENDPSN